MMAAPYEIRGAGGEGKSKKQSMAELKLRRLTELNQRLREDLERRRIPVSEAALEYGPCCCDISPRKSYPRLTVLTVSLHSRTKSPRTGWCPRDGERCVPDMCSGKAKPG